ncbi:hypothetical protein HBP99_16060 [Listeria booriae]|uniref:phage tail domain-containing protein n=1 Tax=Listeria booriae TaxID=1552123 RepID=UPI001623E2DA|nr:phage tail domain-containing protein [Listeria booriae]MBC2370145.1 hypothetical protein [Listeria booriae]
MSYFEYKGKRSDELGLFVQHGQTFPVPEKAVERNNEVDGLSEELIYDRGFYKNVIISFPVIIRPIPGYTVKEQIHEVVAYLYSSKDEPLYTPDDSAYYRMATVTNTMEFVEHLEKVGEGIIEFSAQPYRRAYEGERVKTYTKFPATIYNPTFEPSKPIMRLYGKDDFDIFINQQKMQFKGITDYIEIDCKLLQGKRGAENLSHKIFSYPFFHITPGDNTIEASSNVTKIEIVPRWVNI